MTDENITDGSQEYEATVLSKAKPLSAEDFPAGLTPKELALALQGEVLGHFHLQKFIGGGGMGVVFKALDTTLDRVVAVKVVASRSISDEDLQKRFLVEAQSTARLDHPNIARIHFVGRDRGLPFIVFEFIDGANLRDLVASEGLVPLPESLDFTYQIAHALNHAWCREVVHRDIKPSNILINREGVVKLVDMGLARLNHVGSPEEELTNTGETLGTFDYISPEQARDPRLADIRSDIYSLGCTLFYMLVGRPPFADGTAVQKLLQHQEDVPPDVRDYRHDVPESVSVLIRQMLAKQPTDRPQTPTELIQELTEICQELGIPLTQTLPPLQIPRRRIRRPRWRDHVHWIIPVGALLLVAGVMNFAASLRQEYVVFPPIRVPGEQVNMNESVRADFPRESTRPQPAGSNLVRPQDRSLENASGSDQQSLELKGLLEAPLKSLEAGSLLGDPLGNPEADMISPETPSDRQQFPLIEPVEE